MRQKSSKNERMKARAATQKKTHEIVHMVSWRKIGSLMRVIIFNMVECRHCFVASFNSEYH